MKVKISAPNRLIIAKLEKGDDIYKSLSKIVLDNDIKTGVLWMIGAVAKARIGYFNEESRKYEVHEINEPCEISGVSGNISLKNGKPFVHAHIHVSDKTGKTYGGHLLEGNIISVTGELFILESKETIERKKDPAFDLDLFAIE